MKTRQIGQLTVSAVGLGCMGFSHAYGNPASDEDAVKMIRRAYDELGCTFFDTAEMYVGRKADGMLSVNETLVGAALKDVRNHVVIATKCGIRPAQGTSGAPVPDGRPKNIRRALYQSLTRLGVETIDLYYQHRIDPAVPPEEIAGLMQAFIDEGKIRAWGISETDETYLRRAHAVCPVTAVQNRYSMMARHYEPLFPVLEELGVGFVAFSPLANGFLSGAYGHQDRFTESNDYRSRMPQFEAANIDRNQTLLQLLKTVADAKRATPAQVSLAWMLSKKPWIVPIPGSRRYERIAENFGAADVTLTADEVTALDQALDASNMSDAYGSVGHR